MKIVKSVLVSTCICLGAMLGLPATSDAQNCGITFSPNPGPGTVTIETYWAIGGYASPLYPNLFLDTVTAGNATVPPGVYAGWCIDVTDSIDNGPENYSVLMFSSCDPNLDTELANLGYSYHFTYPATDTNSSAAQWNQLNYLLNHKAPGATYWDVQAAIWDIIGGPLPPNSFFVGYFGSNFPLYNTNLVSQMVQSAVTNAANWQPQCGDVISVVLAITGADTSGDLPVQLTVLEIPFPCVPCLQVTKEVACLQPTNNCGTFGKVASGYAGVGCSGIDQPGFCYQITVTNCGTVPLTNVVVSDNLLGLLTTNFFTNSSQVLLPGAGVTSVFSMSFATNATNTVTVTGQAAVTNTVTNLQNNTVISNGTVFSAFDSAVALVDTASVGCSLSLYSPLDLDGNPSNNTVVLPAATYYSTTNPVTLSIQVCNTGHSALTGVTINMPALASFNCSAPGPFNLAAGACQTFQLCIGLVTCPAQINLDFTVTGQVASDVNHCGVYDLSSTNLISVCSSCTGSISCSTNSGCGAGTGGLSGTVVMDCNPSSSSIAGDTSLPGVPVTLLGAANNPLATNTTDAGGNYSFTNLAAGTYYVLVTPPAGYVETYPPGNTTNEVAALVVVCSDTTNDFGYANTQPPVITIVPGSPLGCNPTNLPTDASVASNVMAVVSCGTATTNISHVDTTNGCVLMRTFTIVVTDTYGNSATNATLVYTWTTDTAAPVLNGIPAGTNYGCNPASVATISNILAGVTASDTCSPATVSATAATATNGCVLTEIFTIVATNACGNMATAYVTNMWTVDTAAPVLNGVPAGTNYGCNPASVASVTDILSGVTASDTCSPATVSATAAMTTNGCVLTEIFTITATNACGNTATASVTNTWTADTAAPVLNGVPAGTNYGCNPAKVASVTDILSGVTASDTCSPATVSATAAMTTNGCVLTEIFTITATNACGNMATAYVTNTWTADTAAPVLNGVPAGTNYGCNPAKVASVSDILSGVTASDTCSPATVSATAATTTNGCVLTEIFTITATNACGNMATAYVTNTWTVDTAAPVLNGVPSGTNYGCNPAKVASVTDVLSGVTASDTCSPATVSATAATTTNGCVLTEIFTITATNACGNTATAYVTNTWTADTAAPVLNNVPASKNYGCNPTNLPTAAGIQALITATDTCSPASVQVTSATSSNGCAMTQIFTITATNACGNTATAYVTNTWTADTAAPVLNGVPAGKNYGCNPTNLPTAASIQALVAATDTCSPASVQVTSATSSNGCAMSQIFTITATNACGNTATAYVTNTWTADTAAPVLNGVPAGKNYGCNPANLPTAASIQALVTATDTCSPASVQVTSATSSNGCAMAQIFTITATNACGNTATAYVTNTWTADTAAPVLNGVPAGKNYGCNPTNLPTAASIQALVTATDTCSPATVKVTSATSSNGCAMSQIFTITATNACGNTATAYVTNTWTADTAAPVLSGVPAGKSFGCNPTNVPTAASIQALVTATDTCSPATVKVTSATSSNGCAMTQVFTIIATNACGNTATAYVTNTWTADTMPPALNGVPAGKNYGCTPTNLPTLASILSGVTASDSCSPATVSGSAVTTTNACGATQIVTITASNACGNTAVAHVTNTWTTPPIIYVTNVTYITNITKATNVVITTNITITTNCCTNLQCGNFNSLNPYGGWLWCNSHISCYPGSNCTINCQGGSITLNCNSGKTYTYPVPNCQINFSSNCTVASNWYDSAGWHTTLPCAGDDEIFCQGCPIPWNSDFANCKSVCWTTAFSCSQTGLNCNWQWGAACYNTSTPTCNQISPKACHATYCPTGSYYSQSDHSGCPENYKPYCQGGGTGGGGANCTGSWSGTETSCTFGTVTNKSYGTNYVVVTNIAVTTNTTVTTTEAGPVLGGVPAGMNFGCNPTNVPTAASVQAAVSAGQTCSTPIITVTGANTTNGCAVTQIFTISAIDGCGNTTTAYVTNTWTVSSGPVITCPPDVTVTNNSGGGGPLTNYCTYTQGGWGADPHGCNAGSLLSNKFSSVYPCGYVQIGITNGTGKCLRFTSSGAVDTFLPCGGTAACLTSGATNCSSCSAGVFAGEVLTLQLNCDFGKSGISPCKQPFGNLVYNCAGSAFNGQTVNQILGLCNTALGGGSVTNCTVNDLQCIANQLNACFDGGCGSGCHTNLSCGGGGTNVVIPPPSQTGVATAADTCSSVTITNSDVVTPGACKGSFVVTRTWIAVDACGMSATCNQTISINPCSTAPPLVEGCAAGSAQVGVAYSSAVVVNGGVAPYTFALVSGSLPAGLTLNTNTGVISGTPTQAGTSTYTLLVTDSLGNTDTEDTPCQLCVTTTSGSPLTCGDTATIGFWNNKNGQAIINCFNGGPGSTNLGYNLATTFPYLYGASSGTNNLANKSNAYIAVLYQQYFSVTGQKVDAEMLAVALDCYATSSSYGGNCAAPYGFNISSSGTAIKTYNVKGNGSTVGLSNNTSYTVLALLSQANLDKQNGSFTSDAGVFNSIFDGINSTGDIH